MDNKHPNMLYNSDSCQRGLLFHCCCRLLLLLLGAAPCRCCCRGCCFHELLAVLLLGGLPLRLLRCCLCVATRCRAAPPRLQEHQKVGDVCGVDAADAAGLPDVARPDPAEGQ